jgi:hypothetical protein
VDTHPIHFHLMNVQIINRVGWDGFIMPPNDNELGWKETVKMNPLEDVIVAVKAKRPPLPGFGVPASIRPMDPSQPLDSPYGFSQIDPATGMPAVVTNQMYNFGWEYTWHCHILGHEENDFMRPVAFNAMDTLVKAPSAVTASGDINSRGISWADATAYGAPASLTDPSAEVGFRVQRTFAGQSNWLDLTAGLHTVRGLTGKVNTLANATAYEDIDTGLAAAAPPTPSNAPIPVAVQSTQATVTWTVPVPLAGSAPIDSFTVWRAEFDPLTDALVSDYAAVSAAPIPFTNAPSYSYTDTAVIAGSVYRYRIEASNGAKLPLVYRVLAVNVLGEAPSSVSTPVTLPDAALSASSGASTKVATLLGAPTLTGNGIAFSNVAGNQATFTWNAVHGAVNYQVRWKQGTSTTNGTFGAWTVVNGTTFNATAIMNNNYVTFEVQALNAVGAASATTSSQLRFILPGTPGAANPVTATAGGLTISWGAVTNASSYVVKVAATQVDLAAAAWTPVAVRTYTFTGLNPNSQYWYQIAAVNNGLQGAANTEASRWTLAETVAAAPTFSNVTPTSLTVDWVAMPGGAGSYRVERSTTPTFTAVNSTIVAGNLTSLNVAGLNLGITTYYFRVVALNGQTPTAVATLA